MPDPYKINLTADQIDKALIAAQDSDKAPSSGHTNLVNSSRIYSFVTSQVGDEADAREAADAALDTRVTALGEILPYHIGFYSLPEVTNTVDGSYQTLNLTATRVSHGILNAETTGFSVSSASLVQVVGSVELFGISSLTRLRISGIQVAANTVANSWETFSFNLIRYLNASSYLAEFGGNDQLSDQAYRCRNLVFSVQVLT